MDPNILLKPTPWRRHWGTAGDFTFLVPDPSRQPIPIPTQLILRAPRNLPREVLLPAIPVWEPVKLLCLRGILSL